jgi:hypothetical protein
MRIATTIEGTTALICNKFGDAAAWASTNGTRTAVVGGSKGTPLEIASAKVYEGLDGKPMIPQPNLMRCLVEGGRYHKAGKKQITTNKESLLYACVDIEGAEIPLVHREPWRVDTRAVVIPATGGRVLAHRPMFDDWSLTFVVELDETFIAPTLWRAIVDDAGRRVGLGDYRPSKKGPYGKFVVTSWQVLS